MSVAFQTGLTHYLRQRRRRSLTGDFIDQRQNTERKPQTHPRRKLSKFRSQPILFEERAPNHG